MSSPYFPDLINKEDKEKLRAAANLIREVTGKYYEPVYSGDDGQYDNSASDGGALALLELAISLIEENGGEKEESCTQ